MISSTKNPKVAAAARLRKRAFRDEDRRFLVEGAQGVREALAADPPAIDTLFVEDALHELAIRARERGAVRAEQVQRLLVAGGGGIGEAGDYTDSRTALKRQLRESGFPSKSSSILLFLGSRIGVG